MSTKTIENFFTGKTLVSHWHLWKGEFDATNVRIWPATGDWRV